MLFAIVRYLSVLVWVEKVMEAPKVFLKGSKISLEFDLGKILRLNAHIMLCQYTSVHMCTSNAHCGQVERVDAREG